MLEKSAISADDATILILEDDAGIAELEKGRLEEVGYRTLLAATPDEALALLRAHSVDLLLLDYRLPGDVDGLTFFETLGAKGFELPVILVTGFSNESTAIRALRAGVRDFVTKSVEYLDYLPEAVGRALRQVRTEQRLAESEARLAGVIDSARDAILVAEGGHTITLFNAAAEQMFRCPAAAAIGQPISRFIPAEMDDGDGNPTTFTHRLRTGTRGVRADGEEFPLEASASRVNVGGRKFYTVMVRDVTERRRLEEQVRQSQKMDAIGALAGGVAHDFNNLLTVILGYCELILTGERINATDRGLVREVHRAGERAASLTRQLLAFSRKQVLSPQVLDLNALIVETERMLRRLIGVDIKLATSLEKNLRQVKVDPGQIEQVVMNLVVNARDAMPTGGHLTIETGNVELDRTYAGKHLNVKPGHYVLLAVTDTGVGMDQATKLRIFEPFFTTKEAGKGTGLGLSTVHGIVRQSGGHIEVYSELGRGTTFKIYLPCLAKDESSPKTPSVILRVSRGAETILLAEDDDDIRLLSRTALQSYGYTVIEAVDGDEGLRLGCNSKEPIHLLITDVVMPGLSGRKLAEKLQEAHPDMRVLYISGYTDDAVVRHSVLAKGVAFLQKPFTPTALARKVRDVLDGGLDNNNLPGQKSS